MPFWRNLALYVPAVWWALFYLIAWSFILTGCARAPSTPSGMPAPVPITAEELLVRVQARGDAIQTMKAQFSIEATGKDVKGTQRMEAALVYQRPSLVRLRTFARIGLPIFDLLLMDGRYQVKIPMQGKYLTGRLAELDRQEGLGPSILLGVQATLGNLTGTSVSPADRVALKEERNLYALEVIPSEEGIVGARRLWFDQRSLDLVREEFLSATGEPQAVITFEDYRPVATIVMGAAPVPISRPYLVKAEESYGRAKLVLVFREIILNAELSPQDWGTAATEPLAHFRPTGMP
jgi:outer membrane lipoprotein-sorting protein